MGACQSRSDGPPGQDDDAVDLNMSIRMQGRDRHSHRQQLARYRERHLSEVYDTHAIIGQGSMGEVCAVTKKKSTKTSESFASLSSYYKDDQSVSNSNSNSSNGSPRSKQIKCFDPSNGTATRYACKTVNTIHMSPDEMEEFMNEIDILRDLDHPNIVQLFEVFMKGRKIWIVTELCSGGDLSTDALDCSEAKVTVILEQTLRALAYMHERNICHRDIKLENIMHADNGPDSEVKLIDFGLSNKFTAGKKMQRECGTVYTCAPELLEQEGYTEKTDVWAVGVVAFVLLSRTYPFLREIDDMDDDFKVAMLRDARYTYGPEWRMRRITKNGKLFVSKCFKKNPDARWTAMEALRFVSHTWIPELAGSTERVVADSSVSPNDDDDAREASLENPLNNAIASKKKKARINSSMLDGMSTFVLYGEFKKTILMTMAYTMDKTSLRELRDIFQVMDSFGNGTIYLEELKIALKQMHSQKTLDDETIEKLFKGIDVDNSGQIHYMEFLAAVSESQGLITIERLAEAFDRIDTDGKGYITRNDIRALLGTDYNEELVQKMMNEADYKKNDQVDYEEFLRLMLKDPTATMNAVEHARLNEDETMVRQLGDAFDSNADEKSEDPTATTDTVEHKEDETSVRRFEDDVFDANDTDDRTTDATEHKEDETMVRRFEDDVFDSNATEDHPSKQPTATTDTVEHKEDETMVQQLEDDVYDSNATNFHRS